jgi:hypothetical protein
MAEPAYHPWLDRETVDGRVEGVDIIALGYDDCEAR